MFKAMPYVIPRGGAQWECHWKYIHLYEKARKKTKNALVETTGLLRELKRCFCRGPNQRNVYILKMPQANLAE